MSLFIPCCQDADRVHTAPLDRSQTYSGKHRPRYTSNSFCRKQKAVLPNNCIYMLNACAKSVFGYHKWCTVKTNGIGLLHSHYKHLSSLEVPYFPVNRPARLGLLTVRSQTNTVCLYIITPVRIYLFSFHISTLITCAICSPTACHCM